jgi:hypothetical protein
MGRRKVLCANLKRNYHTPYTLYFVVEPQACKEFNNIGTWFANIKKEYHAKKLRPERMAMMETLGVDWGKKRSKGNSTTS